MLQVSDAYKELVKSNIRPKCEPIVKVSGIDNTGKEIELVWNAKNIKDLNYKRSIDPVGRELPYMELTWTEIYTGKLNAENYPEKYNNITKYMAVELSFVQDLGFYNTWKTIFNGNTKWKDLFSKSTTWKQLKNQVSQEIITMPKLFLNAKPTIKGQTITWVAKDLLSFANENQVMEFLGGESVKLKNVISYFLVNAKGSFLKSPDLLNSFTNTVAKLLSQEDISELIDKRIICDGNTNNIVLNLASIYNYYLDFEEDIVSLNKFNPSEVAFNFDKKILYAYPTIESSTNISVYSFKNRTAEVDKNQMYTKDPEWYKKYGDNVYHIHYVLNGYGEAYRSEDVINDERVNVGNVKEADLIGTFADTNLKIYVAPINYNSFENAITIDNVGEVFNENNPINPYNAESEVSIARKDFLNQYFADGLSGISFEALPNIAIETNDIIEVDTNLHDIYGQIKKKAIVVYVELNYNGSLKQKIKAHEVII